MHSYVKLMNKKYNGYFPGKNEAIYKWFLFIQVVINLSQSRCKRRRLSLF